ncbi:MAG: bifunctional adenosylcobinamide kinase/adenosylcobinamide-phosphate guanylyltransferase [Thermodesulfovibrionales bacterium]
MEPVKKVVFITGGARSGKSSFALELASRMAGRKVFAATCRPLDAEMRARVEAHRADRARRGQGWETREETLDVAGVISAAPDGVVLVDCLTLWLSNVMLAGRDVGAEVEGLLSAVARAGASVVLVSNEVGMGIVPEGELSRRFRDHAGWLNQRAAAMAGEAYLVVAGVPLRLK